MKRTILLCSAILGILPGLVFAQGYAGGSVGMPKIDEAGFDEDISYSLFGGYRFGKYFAIEGSYTDFGKAEPDDSLGVDPSLGIYLEASGFDVGVLGILPITDMFELFARVGFMAWDIDGGADVLPGVTIGFDGEDFNYGGGLSFNFTPNFNMSAGYQVQRFELFGESGDINNAYISAKYYFGNGVQASSHKKSEAYVSKPSTPSSTPVGTVGQLRSVDESSKNSCVFISNVTRGAGGQSDPSLNLEKAMKLAMGDAAGLGANSYFVVEANTTATGASVILEALSCN